MTTPRAVCVIDDDAAVRDSLRLVLSVSGIEVKDYSSAREFLADPQRRNAGCIVLDLHMPEMSGLELLDLLKEEGSKLPVIVFTGRGDAALREHAVSHGAVTLLAKPVDMELLLEAIERALAL